MINADQDPDVRIGEPRIADFCIIGAQKSGTSTLWHALSQHPDIYMPEQKELNFFFHDEEFAKGTAYYAGFFKDAAPSQICGEASPGYICNPRVPLRIKRSLKSPKLILILRDPVERAHSQYWDNRRWLREKVEFDELVKRPLHQVFQPGKSNYFSRGLYSVYLERYFALFDREQILVLWFDDLRRDPVSVFQRCAEFIGVNTTFSFDNLTQPVNFRSLFDNPLYRYFFNRPHLTAYLPYGTRRILRFGKQTAYKPAPMRDETRRKLRSYYAPFDERLATLLGAPPPWINEARSP